MNGREGSGSGSRRLVFGGGRRNLDVGDAMEAMDFRPVEDRLTGPYEGACLVQICGRSSDILFADERGS